MSNRATIYRYKGDRRKQAFQVQSRAGVVVDITGWSSPRMTAQRILGDETTRVWDIAGTIDDPATGKIGFIPTLTQANRLEGDMEYHFEVEIVDADGLTRTFPHPLFGLGLIYARPNIKPDTTTLMYGTVDSSETPATIIATDITALAGTAAVEKFPQTVTVPDWVGSKKPLIAWKTVLGVADALKEDGLDQFANYTQATVDDWSFLLRNAAISSPGAVGMSVFVDGD